MLDPPGQVSLTMTVLKPTLFQISQPLDKKLQSCIKLPSLSPRQQALAWPNLVYIPTYHHNTGLHYIGRWKAELASSPTPPLYSLLNNTSLSRTQQRQQRKCSIGLWLPPTQLCNLRDSITEVEKMLFKLQASSTSPPTAREPHGSAKSLEFQTFPVNVHPTRAKNCIIGTPIKRQILKNSDRQSRGTAFMPLGLNPKFSYILK